MPGEACVPRPWRACRHAPRARADACWLLPLIVRVPAACACAACVVAVVLAVVDRAAESNTVVFKLDVTCRRAPDGSLINEKGEGE
jgi:hypothetical protein